MKPHARVVDLPQIKDVTRHSLKIANSLTTSLPVSEVVDLHHTAWYDHVVQVGKNFHGGRVPVSIGMQQGYLSNVLLSSG